MSIENVPVAHPSPTRKAPGPVRMLLSILRGSLPALVFVALIALWWAAVAIFKAPSYLLPPPQDVLPRLVSARRSLWNNSLVTLEEIILGFGPTSKVLLTLLLTFFPLLLASIAGFQILDQRLLYLTRSMGATFWQTFRYLRFPAALPVIFGGLKTSATIAATAAIVAEFVGANKGLGYVLLQATGTLDTTLVFSVLFLLTIIGLALNTIVEVAEYLMTPWRRGRGSK